MNFKILRSLFKPIKAVLSWTVNFVKKYKFPIFLILVFMFALFIRIYFSWSVVFSDPIKYTADDGIYHMRLVENMLLGGHFPFRIYFDPFTNFPHGTYIHFTPLYDLIIAGVVWIVSLGKPTLEIINRAAPFVPAVMGSCIVFLVYFLTKALFKNRAIALLAAFLSGISGAYLFRSVLGNTDHHVAEVFFSTLTMMFLVFALQVRREKQPEKFDFEKEFKAEKKFWIMAILTGFCLGLYFLAWTGATMFLFLIFCFIIFYYLFQYFLKNRQNWLLWLGMVIFLASFLMILPFFGHPDLIHTYMYNYVHVIAFTMGFMTFVILILLDKTFLKRKFNHRFIALALALALALIILILRICFPFLFNSLISGLKEVNTGMVEYVNARELVAEMQPVEYNGLVNNFQMLFVASLMSLIAIFYQFVKNKKPEYFLLLLWSVFMVFMSGIVPNFGQVRLLCYLPVVFSILFSFLVIEMLVFGWNGLAKSKELIEGNNLKKYIEWGSVTIILLGLYFFVYPFPFNAGEEFPYSLPYIFQGIKSNATMGISEQDRYDVCEWLRDNTPDVGIDYYSLYEEPDVNKETGEVEDYQYPDSAYGILAVWDFGHMITYYAHRIPVANPFQQGIGKKNANGTIVPGYATFFLAEDEQLATGYLDELKTKYVIADAGSANADGVFQQMIKWQQDELNEYLDSEENLDMAKYYNSMIARLSLFDGRQTNIETIENERSKAYDIQPLNNFRLLYESKTTGFTLKVDDNQEVKNYKIFEYVKGAVIKGRASTGTKIEIEVNIKTNQDREFTYKNSVVSENGQFRITVPYAKKCKIKIGNYEREIEISEEDVLNGNIIQL